MNQLDYFFHRIANEHVWERLDKRVRQRYRFWDTSISTAWLPNEKMMKITISTRAEKEKLLEIAAFVAGFLDAVYDCVPLSVGQGA